MTQPRRETYGSRFHCAKCDAVIAIYPGLPTYDVPCPSCGYELWCYRQTTDEEIMLCVLPDRTPDQEDIERLAESLVRSDWERRLIVDLSRLDTLNSLLLARLVLLNKRVRQAMGRLAVCGMSPVVREILHRTHIDAFLIVLGCHGIVLVGERLLGRRFGS